MKKNYFLSAFALTLLLVFSSCNFDIGNGSLNKKGMKSYNFSKISSLFITNPTLDDGPNNETWVKFQSPSREIYDESIESIENSADLDSYNFPVRTPSFTMENFPKTEERAAEPITRPVQKFKLNQQKNFHNSFDKYLMETKIFKCAYIAEHCYIWIDENSSQKSRLTEDEIKFYAEKFDRIYEKEIALCGPKYDGTSFYSNLIAPNDKISILFYDIDDDKEKMWYFGYFSSDDMILNQGCNIECVHIDSYAAKQEQYRDLITSSLAHEFNHKLNYDNKALQFGLNYDSWYTEMLSLLTEDFFYDFLDIPALASSQVRLSSYINGSYVYGFKNWPKKTNIEGFKYSNVYAFGAFLARNYGGAELMHEICTNQYVNEESVVEAVNKINGTNKTFNDLLQECPFILINIDNKDKNLPSLNKTTYDKIGDFEFSLNPIHPDIFEDITNEKIKIYSYNVSDAPKTPIYAYGFQFYQFDKKTNVKLQVKNDFLVSKY